MCQICVDLCASVPVLWLICDIVGTLLSLLTHIVGTGIINTVCRPKPLSGIKYCNLGVRVPHSPAEARRH